MNPFFALSAALLLAPAVVLAQSVTRVTGSASATWAQGAGYLQIAFSCEIASGAAGPCSGTYQATNKDVDCSNAIQIAGTFVLTGLDLSHPGPIQGGISFSNSDYSYVRNANGTCAIVPGTGGPGSTSYTGTWDGTRGTIASPPETDPFGNAFQTTGTFTASSSSP
ncbi:MAG: hypothetical protein ACREQL_05435, partial [Candidatus Binatia bacterium]